MASSNCTEQCHFRGIWEKTLSPHCNIFDTFDMNLLFLVSRGLDVIERDVFLVYRRTYLKVKDVGVNRSSFPQLTWGITTELVYIKKKNPPKHVDRISQKVIFFKDQKELNDFLYVYHLSNIHLPRDRNHKINEIKLLL